MLSPADQRAMLVAEVTEYTKAIETKGMWIKGSQHQDILNPALASRRAALEAIRKLDAQSPVVEKDPLDEFNNEGH